MDNWIIDGKLIFVHSGIVKIAVMVIEELVLIAKEIGTSALHSSESNFLFASPAS